MTALDVIVVLAGLPMDSIGRRPRTIVATRGAMTSAMEASTATLRTAADGSGLFGLFNYLSI